MRALFLSFGGTGYLRPAPGTWGSLAGLVVGVGLIHFAGPLAFLLGLVIVTLASLKAVRDEMDGSAEHDPSWIVIDEVVGQWVALLPVVAGIWMSGADVFALWPGIVTAFVFFRLFDIWKPGLVGKLDQREDPDSIVLDDLAAGLYAAGAVGVLAAVAHGAMRAL